MSSGGLEKPSKTNLFLAFHRFQSIQGARDLDVIPKGGKHGLDISAGKESTKSIITLISTAETKGARRQTFLAS